MILDRIIYINDSGVFALWFSGREVAQGAYIYNVMCLPCCIRFRCEWFCINITYRWYAPRQRRRHRIIAVHYCITIRIFHWFHRHCDDVVIFFLLSGCTSVMQFGLIENVRHINHTHQVSSHIEFKKSEANSMRAEKKYRKLFSLTYFLFRNPISLLRMFLLLLIEQTIIDCFDLDWVRFFLNSFIQSSWFNYKFS